MTGFFIFWGIVSWIVNIILTGWLAKQKERSVLSWIVLAVFFPLLAIIALAGAPAILDEEKWRKGIPGASVRQEDIQRYLD